MVLLMFALSIILFFVYTWGFGVGAGLLVKESENFLERNIIDRKSVV